MSREYGKVATRFWTDSRILGLTGTEKLVFLYLLAGSQTNCAGCFRCTESHLAADAVCSADDGARALARLADLGLIVRDPPVGIVWLPRWLRYNPITSPAVGKGALMELMALPSSKIIGDVIGSLEPFGDKMPNMWRDKLLPMSIDAPTDRSPDRSPNKSTDTPADVSSAPIPSHPNPTQPKEALVPATDPPGPARDELREKEWTDWLAFVEADIAEGGFSAPVWSYYVVELLRGLSAFYEARGGRLTPTRRAYLARNLSKYDTTAQLLAIEVYCDNHAGTKDERYIVGIARAKDRLAIEELDRDWLAHRQRQNGRGLWAGRPQ